MTKRSWVAVAVVATVLAIGIAVVAFRIVGAYQACIAAAHGKPVICAVGL